MLPVAYALSEKLTVAFNPAELDEQGIIARVERIGYGITIPADAPHPDAAALFIEFLLGPEGRAIMDANHHPLFDPCLADGYASMPQNLQAICVPITP